MNLLLWIALLPLSLAAQPVLTPSYYPVAGDLWQFERMDTTTAPVTGGAAQSAWIYQLATDSSLGSVQYMNPSQLPGAAAFPGSHIGWTDGGGSAWFADTVSGFFLKGGLTLSDTIKYSDPKLLFHFPVTFGDTLSDQFSGTVTDTTGGASSFSGSTTLIADGYGELHMPWVSLTNILRTRTTDSVFQSGGDTLVTDVYRWYYDLEKFQVLEISESRFTDGTGYSRTALVNSVFVSAAEIAGKEPLHLFPNPASDHVNIRLEEPSEIIIQDVNGKELSRISADPGQFRVPVTGFPEGIYLISVKSASGIRVGRFVRRG